MKWRLNFVQALEIETWLQSSQVFSDEWQVAISTTDTIEYCRKVVINKAPDIDIWHAVLDLITSLSRLTSPTSIPPSFDGTPVTYSSASQQGNEQTKRILDPLLLHEFRYCTYRNVQGFFSKYLKERSGVAEYKKSIPH